MDSKSSTKMNATASKIIRHELLNFYDNPSTEDPASDTLAPEVRF